MATAEKGSLLKNVKIKIKDKEEEKNSKDQANFNVSGEDQNEKDKNSSKFSEENKEIANDKLELSEGEEEQKKNDNVIKENPEEAKNAQNISKEEENENSENKSDLNNNNISEKEEENNANASGGMRGSHPSDNNNNSSFLNSNHYNNLQNINENDDLNDSDDGNNYFIDRTKPFLTTGKFMQIQPHFHIFSKQIDDLHNGLYENTKKCLIYKCSLQQSENLIREKADNVVKDLVDKIFNLRQLFTSANKSISATINEVNQNVLKVKQIQANTKKDMHECDRRVNACESQIGYKLLGKPNYSFMKRFCSTTTK
jgi:hypothetical protein